MTIDLDALEKLADEAEANGTVQRIFEYRRNTDPATIKALIAELKEARGLLAAIATSRVTEDNPYLWKWASTVIIKARAFLARNGKGEG